MSRHHSTVNNQRNPGIADDMSCRQGTLLRFPFKPSYYRLPPKELWVASRTDHFAHAHQHLVHADKGRIERPMSTQEFVRFQEDLIFAVVRVGSNGKLSVRVHWTLMAFAADNAEANMKDG
jgi:hypothetical protein